MGFLFRRLSRVPGIGHDWSAPGIRLCEHIEDADGAVVFRAACNLRLEDVVAKRRDSRYRSGRCREWIKIKTRRIRRSSGRC